MSENEHKILTTMILFVLVRLLLFTNYTISITQFADLLNNLKSLLPTVSDKLSTKYPPKW